MTDETLLALANWRDDLAIRLLRGETLTEAEHDQLAALSIVLEARLPQSPPLPADVLAAVEEAERG